MRMKYSHTKILYMVSRNELTETIEDMYEEGERVVCVSPLREFQYPHMDGVAITDWLIVYEEDTKATLTGGE